MYRLILHIYLYFLFPLPFLRLSLSYGLCEPGARRDDDALRPLLRVLADGPLQGGTQNPWGELASVVLQAHGYLIYSHKAVSDFF